MPSRLRNEDLILSCGCMTNSLFWWNLQSMNALIDMSAATLEKCDDIVSVGSEKVGLTSSSTFYLWMSCTCIDFKE